MSGKSIKKLRNYIMNNTETVLILLRNEYGDKTTEMDERSIYQYAKKLYKQGKIRIS